MNDLYAEALQRMLVYFETLANLIEKPKKVKIGDGYTYRYESSSLHAAILQKLSRVLTGIQAVHLLNIHGFLQEQAALQRVLDELTEDISFLAYAIIFNDHTDLHERYLKAFYEEEYDDPSSAMESSQKRPMIPRKKIRAYVNKVENGGDQSTGIEAGRTISKAYSGYVHGASPHIMELYFGKPPKFHLRGSQDSPLYRDHIDDLLNYFYRGLLALACSAKSFGNDDMFNEIYSYSKDFARRSGRSEQLTPYV